MEVRDLASLGLLGAIWGASFLFIRIAAPHVGPVGLMAQRVLLAGTLLFLCAVASRQPRAALRERWREFVVLGAINAAVPFTLIAASELYISSGLAAILNSTTPLWTAIVAAVRLGEPLTARRVLGLLLGVAGVGMLAGWSPAPLTLETVLAIAASIVAAVSYAFGSVYAARMSRGLPPLILAAGQQLGAAAVLVPVALFTLPARWPPVPAVLAALTLAILCTAVAYLIYFPLIARVGATRTMSVTYLVPIFGTFWGALILGEPVSPGMVGGLLLILVSVFLVTGVQAPRPAPRPAAAPPPAATPPPPAPGADGGPPP